LTQLLFVLNKIVLKSSKRKKKEGSTNLSCISCKKDMKGTFVMIGKKNTVGDGLVGLLPSYLSFKYGKPLLWDQAEYWQGE